MIPGEVLTADGDIVLNKGATPVSLDVANADPTGGSGSAAIPTPPRPSPALAFDREAAHGMRLDITAGTAVRFEPGQTREVPLVPLGGGRTIDGFNDKVMGAL